MRRSGFFMLKKQRDDDHNTNTSTDFHFYASELSFFNTDLELLNAFIYLEHIGSENGFNTGLLKYQHKIDGFHFLWLSHNVQMHFLKTLSWWRMYVRRRIDLGGGERGWKGADGVQSHNFPAVLATALHESPRPDDEHHSGVQWQLCYF